MPKLKGSVWVYAEQHGGVLHDVGFELLSKGRELSDRLQTGLAAVLVGSGVRGKAQELLDAGADMVLLADRPWLEPFDPELHAEVLARAARRHEPGILLVGSTWAGRDLAPAAAARLGTGVSSHCTALDLDPAGNLLQIIPAYGGLGHIVCRERRPQIATASPGVFRRLPARPRQGELLELGAELEGLARRCRVVEVISREDGGTMPLEGAEVVVAGGAGIGDRESWKLVEELARALGGAVGATRPPVDEGWAREDQMIGQSGKAVRPRLYVGIGISGEMQHTVGIAEAGTVVAINIDPKARIFEVSDYGIVGDFRRVVPLMIAEFGGRKV